MTQEISTAVHFMPVMDFAQVAQRYNAVAEIANKMLRAEHDYGKVTGTDKNTLLKPGAEKLCTLFGLTPRMTIVQTRNRPNNRCKQSSRQCKMRRQAILTDLYPVNKPGRDHIPAKRTLQSSDNEK